MRILLCALLGASLCPVAWAGDPAAPGTPSDASGIPTGPTGTQSTSRDRVIEVSVGESVIRQESRAVSRILISDPDVVELRLLEEGQYQIRALAVGKTDLWVWFRGDEAHPISYQILVSNSQIFEVRRRIEATGGASSPRVYTIQERLVVEGAVDDLETLERVAAVARIYDPTFVNLMTVRGDNQVQMQVVFAEVNRSALRELGMGALLTLRAGNSAWTPQMDLPVDPAGVYTLSLTGSMSQASLQAFLSVLEQNSLARTLVQPTLVALSGQEANFLAGGEIPIPVGQVNGFISIEYKKYGIGVAFVPTVLSGDVVDMRVSVGVSDIDPSSGIQLVGVSVPGLTVREVESHLRLRSGMTFAMAGLLSEHTVATRSQIPLLGDIPLIGTLFRYVQHDRQETELMIFVTPTLVRPMAAADVPPPPGTTENYNPSDLDLFLLGSLTAGPATRTAQPTGAYGLAR